MWSSCQFKRKMHMNSCQEQLKALPPSPGGTQRPTQIHELLLDFAWISYFTEEEHYIFHSGISHLTESLKNLITSFCVTHVFLPECGASIVLLSSVSKTGNKKVNNFAGFKGGVPTVTKFYKFLNLFCHVQGFGVGCGASIKITYSVKNGTSFERHFELTPCLFGEMEVYLLIS